MEHASDEAGPRKLIRRASIVAAGTGYQQGLSFLSALIVARVIGASEYGIYNLARNLVDLAGTFTRLGLDLGLQRYFGEISAARDRASPIAVLRRVRLLASTFALLPVVAIALGLGRVLEENVYHYSRFAEILLCLALALPFTTDLAVLGGAYRGILKLSPSVIAECVLLPTFRLAAIVVLFLAGWRLWAVVAGTTFASLAASAFLAMRARTDFRGGAPDQPHSWRDALRIVGYSSVLAVTVLVGTLMASMDMLMLGRFATAQDLGQYSLVKTLLLLMGVAAAAFSTGLGALVAERHFRGDFDGMVRVMSLSARLIALATAPIFAIFLIWGAPLTLLFGPSFAVSQSVVSWLAVSQFVFLILGPSGWALSMTGKHFLELKILSAGLAVATVLSWVAVPAYGQLGAAVATCTSMTAANLARVLFVRRALGAFPFDSDVIFISAAGIGLGLASATAIGQLSLPTFWSTTAGICLFVLSYAVACWTHLLKGTERIGISRAIRGTAPLPLGR